MKAVVVVLLLASSLADAEYYGNQFARMCAGNLEFAQGYMAGYLDKALFDIAAVSMTRRQPTTAPAVEAEKEAIRATTDFIQDFCVPEGAVLGQATDVVCKYVKDNPGDRQRGLAF